MCIIDKKFSLIIFLLYIQLIDVFHIYDYLSDHGKIYNNHSHANTDHCAEHSFLFFRPLLQ